MTKAREYLQFLALMFPTFLLAILITVSVVA